MGLLTVNILLMLFLLPYALSEEEEEEDMPDSVMHSVEFDDAGPPATIEQSSKGKDKEIRASAEKPRAYGGWNWIRRVG